MLAQSGLLDVSLPRWITTVWDGSQVAEPWT